MEKEKYEVLDMEVIWFETEDVLTISDSSVPITPEMPA